MSAIGKTGGTQRNPFSELAPCCWRDPFLDAGGYRSERNIEHHGCQQQTRSVRVPIELIRKILVVSWN